MEKGTTEINAEELNKIQRCINMDFSEDLFVSIKKLCLVRSHYASDFMSTEISSEKHKQAREGINWCNKKLENILSIISQ